MVGEKLLAGSTAGSRLLIGMIGMHMTLGWHKGLNAGAMPLDCDVLYRLAAGDDGERGSAQRSSGPFAREGDDLPYKVELWNDTHEFVDQVLAVTADASIGYGAYYAAIRQFPDRHITLRHKGKVISKTMTGRH